MADASAAEDASIRWELWREDDNGVRALITVYTDQRAALDALARFESLGHKQTYWLKKRASTASEISE